MSGLTRNHIKSTYSKAKESSDYENHPWAFYVIRPFSFWVTPFFIKLGFTATKLTLFGFLPLFAGFFFISLAGQPYELMLGALLFNIWYLIDFIDGNIARFQKNSTYLGKYLDSFAGTLFHIFIPLSLAIFFYRNVHIENMYEVGMTNQLALYLSISIMIFFALRKILSQKFTLINANLSSQSERKVNNSLIIYLMRWISSLKSPLLLILSIFGALKVWIWIFSIYTLFSFMGILMLNVKKLSKAI